MDATQAELVLKGFSRLKFHSPKQALLEARTNERRWWWEYLRLSKDYWLLCQTSTREKVQTQDQELARVYRRFGDVHQGSFDDWWLDRGAGIFKEVEKFPTVNELPRSPRDRAPIKLRPDHIWVDIPLKLSRRTIQRKIGEILDQYESLRLSNRLELTTAEFQLQPAKFGLHTLQKIHEVHSLHRELIAKPKALAAMQTAKSNFQQRADLFRIGKALGVSPSNEALRGDLTDIHKRQNRMRVSVSRLLGKCDLLIANVERGLFPSYNPVPITDRPRFNKRQLEMHQDLEAQWWALDLQSELSAGKLEKARQIHYEEELKIRDSYKSSKINRTVVFSDA
jgi:hypothetical protein